jgi:hypothetical protein
MKPGKASSCACDPERVALHGRPGCSEEGLEWARVVIILSQVPWLMDGVGMVQAQAQRQKLSAKVAKKYAKKAYGSSGATSGLSSSLAFTPIQVPFKPSTL